MSNFKRFFRKNKGVNIIPDKRKAVQTKVEEKNGTAGKDADRRFTLLVEDAFESSRLQGVMVLGKIYGRIRVGDTVYLYRGEKPTLKLNVLAIENGPRDMTETAKNQKTGICLDLEDLSEIPKYSVICSTPPMETIERDTPIENPRLLGLTMEYKNLYQNPEYFDALVYEVCKARLVVSLYMDQPPVPNPDGTFSFGKGAHIGFPALKKWDDDTKSVFPVFTDWGALYNWKGAFHEGQPKRTVNLRIQDAIAATKNGHAGMVINPFGPATVYFPLELLEQIEQTEGYRKMFQEKEQ